jgi:ubiquinone/menaquinone biosynthesis C-methylase UbiE
MARTRTLHNPWRRVQPLVSLRAAYRSTSSAVTSFDAYRVTDQLDDGVLDAIATRLEVRGRHPVFVEMMDEYLDAMDIDGAETVVDLGCGTGVASRRVAGRSGFSGRVTGVDRSPYLITAAAGLASDEGLAAQIDFRVGDTQSLDLDDDGFDAVVAHTLISHVESPAAVLAEAARIAEPGASIGIFDGDYASLTFGNPDPEQGKRDDDAVIAAIVTNPRVMRQMPVLASEAGLELVESFPYVLAEVGTADFWLPAIESFRRIMPTAGAMSEAEANAWAERLLEASESGLFFGASNYYGYVLRKPDVSP